MIRLSTSWFKNFNVAQDVDCGHGWIEERNRFVTDKIDWLG